MAVLVTGGAGYIGSHMILELIERQERVVVLDNLTTGFSWAVPDSVEFIVGDVGDEKLVDRILRDCEIDAIFHFAGSVVVPESVSDPLGYYSNNTVNTHTLISSAVKSGVKNFIFFSTAAVYGQTGAKSGKAEILKFYTLAVKNGAKLSQQGSTRIAGNAAAFAFTVSVGAMTHVDKAVDVDLPTGGMVIDVIDTFYFNEAGKVTEMKAYWGPSNITQV